jgi:hypothetical protein
MESVTLLVGMWHLWSACSVVTWFHHPFWFYYYYSSSSCHFVHTHTHTHAKLVEWIQGPRGLEGYSSRMHAMRRQRHFQDYKHCVFLEQARQNLNATKDDSMLAQQAQQSSRRARSFAILLGTADARAVSQEAESKQFDDTSFFPGTRKTGWKKAQDSPCNIRNVSSGDDETHQEVVEPKTSDIVDTN